MQREESMFNQIARQWRNRLLSLWDALSLFLQRGLAWLCRPSSPLARRPQAPAQLSGPVLQGRPLLSWLPPIANDDSTSISTEATLPPSISGKLINDRDVEQDS